MKRCLLYLATFIFTLLLKIDNANSSDLGLALDDLRENLTIEKLATETQRKLKNHIEEPVYLYISSINTMQIRGVSRPYYLFGIEYDDVRLDLREDIVDSVKYGVEHSVRDLQLYTLARQWILGLFTLQMDKPREQKLVLESPSIDRPLNYYDELRNKVNFECGNIVGRSAKALEQRISCYEASVFIKRSEEKVYKFRVRPGLDVNGFISSKLNIAPTIEPYLNIKFRNFDTELTYIIPSVVYKHKQGKKHSLFEDFSDAFFDEDKGKHDRFRLSLNRYQITDRFSIKGSYQFERLTGKHFVDLSARFVYSPYNLRFFTHVDVLSGEPQMTLSLERFIGKNIIIGVGGFAENPPQEKWNYQIGATTQLIW